MAEFQYLTREGYDKILKELDDLKTRGRSDVSKAIAEAREKGDLSENAEYHAAKDEQGMLELKISELEQVMSNARIIDKSLLDTSHVVVFAKVTIRRSPSQERPTPCRPAASTRPRRERRPTSTSRADARPTTCTSPDLETTSMQSDFPAPRPNRSTTRSPDA
jgi:transcription elongation factor GreA